MYIFRGGTVMYLYRKPSRYGPLGSVALGPCDEYRQFTPNPEGYQQYNAMLFDNHQRQQKNSECSEFRAWKHSPLDRDHVLILNTSLTWTDKSFVLVYPTSLIRHNPNIT